MSKFRPILIAILATAWLVPAFAAHASGDVAAEVRTVAQNALDLVTEEQALLAVIATDGDTPDTQAELRSRLMTVDGEGVAVLGRLEGLDVELTEPIRAALAPLTGSGSIRASATQLQPPPGDVYAAALADLRRISDTPDAALPGDRTSSSTAGSTTRGLLVVAVLSLLALGAAAFISSVRRRPISDELAAMAWSDGLTGLANRRRLDHDLASHGRRDAATAVIMIDVDHFKSVNDRFGHQTGDEVLRSIGAMLAEQIRYDDIVYRYGGEEFCVLLPDSSVAEAERIADRIVEAAREIQLPDGQHITVSVGVASATEGDISTAVETADLALYTAKDRGRNRAVTADSDQPNSAGADLVHPRSTRPRYPSANPFARSA